MPQYTFYHGTTSLNRDSIEKRGLYWNPIQQRYTSHHIRTVAGRKPLGGIYLGTYEVAFDYAKAQAKFYGGSMLLVKVSLTPNRFCAFDDDMTGRIVQDIIHWKKNRGKIPKNKVFDQYWFMTYKLTPDIITRSLSKISIDMLQKATSLSTFTRGKLDFLSRDLGNLIPFIKNKPDVHHNPFWKIRYLANIKFSGSTRITDIIEEAQ